MTSPCFDLDFFLQNNYVHTRYCKTRYLRHKTKTYFNLRKTNVFIFFKCHFLKCLLFSPLFHFWSSLRWKHNYKWAQAEKNNIFQKWLIFYVRQKIELCHCLRLLTTIQTIYLWIMKGWYAQIFEKNETTFGQQKLTFWLGFTTGFCHFVFFPLFSQNSRRFWP